MAKTVAFLSPSACIRGRLPNAVRVLSYRPFKDASPVVRGPAPACCVPGTTQLQQDESGFVDLAEFGLEGTARVARSGTAVNNVIETRLRVRKQGHCYGCGVKLQTGDAGAAGYVDTEKFNLKRMHHQTDKILCYRCTDLCNGKMVPAVEDFAQRAAPMFGRAPEALTLNGKTLISPEDLRRQLMEVGSKKALVLMLVDLLDVSGTLMSKVRDLVGRNPIILVGTKMDLLPAGAHPKAVAQWLLDAAMYKRLNVVSAHLVSSHTMEGISAIASKACAERKGRDVYVIGAANVGKSAFVRAFLRELRRFDSRNFDAAALGSGKYLPVESAMPGTTLGLIPLQAFASGGTLFDTPGVHLHHRIPHMLSPEELKSLHPRKRLCVYRPPSPADIAGEQEQEPAAMDSRAKSVSATYQWSDLVRVDILEAPATLSLVFQGPHSMKVTHGPLIHDAPKHDIFTQDRSGAIAPSQRSVLSCAASVAQRGGLVPHMLQVAATGGGEQAVADIAISGLPGWVTLWVSHGRGDIKLRVWAVRGVEVFLRPPFPAQLPEQLQDEVSSPATATGATASKGQPRGAPAAADDTSARVRQIFRRYQVQEVQEEADPDANELLALLQKEVAELEDVTPTDGSDTDDDSSVSQLEALEDLDHSQALQGPSTSSARTAAGSVSSSGRTARTARESMQRASIGGTNTPTTRPVRQRISALFDAALEDAGRSASGQDVFAQSSQPDASPSTSSRVGAENVARIPRTRPTSNQGRAPTRTMSGLQNAVAQARRSNLQPTRSIQASESRRYVRSTSDTGLSDLSSLFGAALEDSVIAEPRRAPATGTRWPAEVGDGSMTGAAPDVQTDSEQADWNAGTPLAAPRQASKLRSRARALADNDAAARKPYNRPSLFPDEALVSGSSPAAAAGDAPATNIPALAAKYSALSQTSAGGSLQPAMSKQSQQGSLSGALVGNRLSVDMSGRTRVGERSASDSPQAEYASGRSQSRDAEELAPETFVLDEDLISEIAAQVKQEGARSMDSAT